MKHTEELIEAKQKRAHILKESQKEAFYSLTVRGEAIRCGKFRLRNYKFIR